MQITILNFKENKSKSDDLYKVRDCEIEDWMLTIIKNEKHPFYSVYAKRYVRNENKRMVWYMEVSGNQAETFHQAKSIAMKLYGIVLWYNPPKPWKE